VALGLPDESGVPVVVSGCGAPQVKLSNVEGESPSRLNMNDNTKT
jgi:hypothetical protein